MTIIFAPERVTKNTIRFAEVLQNEMDTPKVGSLYVPKATLGVMGWSDGKKIAVELNVEGSDGN